MIDDQRTEGRFVPKGTPPSAWSKRTDRSVRENGTMRSTTVQVELVHETCPECSITYGIPEALYEQRRRDAEDGTVWCPNGHQWHYRGKSHEKELADLRAAREGDRAYGIRQRDRADANYRSLRTTKGHVTRLKNRAAEGWCQWCDEVIDDMAQHVATIHPERVNNEPGDGP